MLLNSKRERKIIMGTGKKAGIKQQVTKAITQVSMILSAAAVLAVIILFVMSQRYEHALKYYGFSQGDIGHAMTAFAEARSSLRAAIGYDEPTEIAQLTTIYKEKKEDFATYMKDVEAIIVTKEGQEAYDAIVSKTDEYWVLSDEIMSVGASTNANDSALAQKRAFEELSPKYDEVYNALQDLMDVNVVKGNETQNIMFILKIVAIIVLVLLILIAAVISNRIGNKIADKIQKPLEALGVRLNAFAHGDLNSPFPEVETEDEIGAMTEECKSMAENLNLIISDAGELMGEMANGNFAVRTNIEEKYEGQFHELLMAMRKLNRQLDGTLKQINEASDQVTTGASQLADSAQDLAEGATEQAGAIEELTATVESVTSISEQSLENATSAANKAKVQAKNATKSQTDMDKLTGAMERIMETSKEIENIIVTIEDIASQTNLLSLNASIEAARAGEAGKGFAVVADQIGKLASDSAQSAVTTKELIGKALDEITIGNQIVDNTTKTMGEVINGMVEFADVASGSAEASRVQADMLKQIELGIEQISSVVQSNSAAAEETSAISEELSAQAISLQEMVATFVLRQE